MLTTKSPMVFFGWAEAVLEYHLQDSVRRWLSWLVVRHNRLVAPLSEEIERDRQILEDLERLKAWYHANK